jgi:hypothetical protein
MLSVTVAIGGKIRARLQVQARCEKEDGQTQADRECL